MNYNKLNTFSLYKSIKKTSKGFRNLLLFGNCYHCILCNGNFRRLLPTGISNEVNKNLIGAGRRHVRCPKCSSTDRERLIYFYIKNKTTVLTREEGINLLHIAPEKNLRKIFKSKENINYFPGDVNPKKGDLKMDITNLEKYKDNLFDVIICSHVLEHVPNDKKAMKELHRVLSQNGFSILQVPISETLQKTYEDFSITNPKERKQKFGQKDHVRIYGKDYVDRLRKAGFKVEEYNIKKDLSLPDLNKYGLNKKETLFVCKKQ